MKASIKSLMGILGILITISACSTSQEKKSEAIQVSYEEFQKLLSPRSIVVLEGQNAFLTVIAMPGDKYPKVYRYNIDKESFTLDYDHGYSVKGLTEDRAGKNIYLLIDNKGDENTKIYTYNTSTRKPTLLFGVKDRKSYVINSDKNGKNLFIISNHENKSVYSIFRMNMKSKKMQRMSDGKTNLMSALISEDGKWIAAARYFSNNENRVYLINGKTKKMTTLFEKKNSTFHLGFFSKNGKDLYGTSDDQRDRSGCAKISLGKTKKLTYVIEDANKDISCAYGEWTDVYFVTENSKGKSTLRMYKRMFKDEIPVPQLFNNQSVGTVGFDRKSKKLLLKFSAANNPGSLYNFNFKTMESEKVLDYNQSAFPAESLATSYDFEYKSFDGMNIHGIIYAMPDWKSSGKKYPLVLWPHGGPDSHEGHRYREWFQYLALNGFVVFAPNYRGSTGYGKNFETLNDKDWGGAHIKDLVSGREAVEQLPWIDQDNAFIFGGSFGGYSTLATTTFQPESFKAAVGFVALGNLFTFMKSLPPDEAWQSEFTREIGHPVQDKALYRERSPFFHVDKIKMPLQIYQAENDVRTVKSEMDQFVAELNKQGKPVEYTVLKDVGHSLARPEARKQVLEGTVKFFRSHIR